jgi:protein disulfide-isomerase
MKSVVRTLIAAAACLALSAAVPLRAEPAKESAGLTWQTDYKAALAQAKKEKKGLLLDFTGSDWCGYCIQLHKNVFSKPEFEKWAGKNFILVELDFPRKKPISPETKKQNEALSQKYKVEGFPTIIILDNNEKKLSESVGYSGESADKWIAAREAEVKAAQKK